MATLQVLYSSSHAPVSLLQRPSRIPTYSPSFGIVSKPSLPAVLTRSYVSRLCPLAELALTPLCADSPRQPDSARTSYSKPRFSLPLAYSHVSQESSTALGRRRRMVDSSASLPHLLRQMKADSTVEQVILTVFSSTLLSAKTAKKRKIAQASHLSALAAELGAEVFVQVDFPLEVYTCVFDFPDRICAHKI